MADPYYLFATGKSWKRVQSLEEVEGDKGLLIKVDNNEAYYTVANDHFKVRADGISDEDIVKAVNAQLRDYQESSSTTEIVSTSYTSEEGYGGKNEIKTWIEEAVGECTNKCYKQYRDCCEENEHLRIEIAELKECIEELKEKLVLVECSTIPAIKDKVNDVVSTINILINVPIVPSKLVENGQNGQTITNGQ